MPNPRTIPGKHKVKIGDYWHLSECLMVEHPEYSKCTCGDWYPDGDSG